MLTVMISLMLYGPMETATKPTLTIYVDKTSRDYDIKRRSRMVEHELKMPLDNPWLQRERIYLRGNYDFRVIDVLDLPSFPKAREFPCVRITKNSECTYFPENTFAANGMFTLTMRDIVTWMKFERSTEEFESARSTIVKIEKPKDFFFMSEFDEIDDKFQVPVPIIDDIEFSSKKVVSFTKPREYFTWLTRKHVGLLHYPSVPRKEFEK